MWSYWNVSMILPQAHLLGNETFSQDTRGLWPTTPKFRRDPRNAGVEAVPATSWYALSSVSEQKLLKGTVQGTPTGVRERQYQANTSD